MSGTLTAVILSIGLIAVPCLECSSGSLISLAASNDGVVSEEFIIGQASLKKLMAVCFLIFTKHSGYHISKSFVIDKHLRGFRIGKYMSKLQTLW